MSTALDRIKRRDEMIKLKENLSYRKIGKRFSLSHEAVRLIIDPDAKEKSCLYKKRKRKENKSPLKNFEFDLWKKILLIKIIHPESTLEQIANHLRVTNTKVSQEWSLVRAFLEKNHGS